MDIGKSLIVLGLFISITGVVFYLVGDKLNYFGHLLGDFRYESKNINFFVPITSMLIISLLLSFIINIIIRIFR